jgi:Domain of unknown function (DUF6456)
MPQNPTSIDTTPTSPASCAPPLTVALEHAFKTYLRCIHDTRGKRALSSEIQRRLLTSGYLVVDQRTGTLSLTVTGQAAIASLSSSTPSARSAASQRMQKTATQTPHLKMPDAAFAAATVLQWLRRRRDANGQPHLTAVQVEAGERLAADFLRGNMMPRVTADWSSEGGSTPRRRGVPGYGVEMRDGTASAQDRFRGALIAVGPEFADLLINVCCFDFGLAEIEKGCAWPKRTAKLFLQIALTQLARHYGLIRHEPDVSKIRHSANAGYRPTLAAWA